jgi:hypothetical protein
LVEAQEAAERAPTDTDYITLSFERLYLRDLAGIRPGQTVAVGIAVGGADPEKRTIKTVALAEVTPEGLALRDPVPIGPFRFVAQTLSLEIRVAPVAKRDLNSVRGMLAGAANLLRHVHPSSPAAVNTAKDIFNKILSGLTRKLPTAWVTEILLHPANARSPAQSPLLLAGTSILVWLPPADAPIELRKRVVLRELTTQLALRGNRLFWRSGGEEEYASSPYLVLAITREKRLARDRDLPHRQREREAESLLAVKKYDGARKANAAALKVLASDRHLTVLEGLLDQRRLEIQRLRIDRAVALEAGKTDEARALAATLAKELGGMLRSFERILSPGEAMELRTAAREAANEAASPSATVPSSPARSP